MPAQDATAVNMVYSFHLHVANVEVQILQSSLTKVTAKMSNPRNVEMKARKS